jgi:hypothetical protein
MSTVTTARVAGGGAAGALGAAGVPPPPPPQLTNSAAPAIARSVLVLMVASLLVGQVWAADPVIRRQGVAVESLDGRLSGDSY